MSFEKSMESLGTMENTEFTLERRSWWLGRYVKFTIKGHAKFLSEIIELCGAQIKGIKKNGLVTK